jgi:hypothetical protein
MSDPIVSGTFFMCPIAIAGVKLEEVVTQKVYK